MVVGGFTLRLKIIAILSPLGIINRLLKNYQIPQVVMLSELRILQFQIVEILRVAQDDKKPVCQRPTRLRQATAVRRPFDI